jgi:hypothetical protein
LGGATGQTYTISAAVVSDAGSYTVVVTNVVGSTTSAAATLAVTPATALFALGNLAAIYDGTA